MYIKLMSIIQTKVEKLFISLAPGKFEWNFSYLIFKKILMIASWSISCELALIWMLLDLTNDRSTLVQVKAWRRQATSHYLSQCWPRAVSPNGVTRPEWVKILLYRITYLCQFALSAVCLRMNWRVASSQYPSSWFWHRLSIASIISRCEGQCKPKHDVKKCTRPYIV